MNNWDRKEIEVRAASAGYVEIKDGLWLHRASGATITTDELMGGGNFYVL